MEAPGLNQGTIINWSIRGRVAFGIVGLQAALHHCQQDVVAWQPVLMQLWSLMTTDELEDWFEVTAEYLPEENGLPYERSDRTQLNAVQYQYLQQLYQRVPPFIPEMIELIFYIGSTELYGSIVDGSEITLSHTLAIAQLLQQQGIALPDYELFQPFRITIDGGWGRKLSRSEVEALATTKT
jgi:hypothetical protein